MKKIPLTPLRLGKYAIVDDEDYDELMKHSWRYQGPTAGTNTYGYAARHFYEGDKQRCVLMHRFILQVPRGFHTDHKNGNPLDNRKENIRICNRSENMCNRKMHSNNTSGVKGVTKARGKGWVAQIQHHKKLYGLGYYKTIEEARAAYDAASRILHGEFGRPNSAL